MVVNSNGVDNDVLQSDFDKGIYHRFYLDMSTNSLMNKDQTHINSTLEFLVLPKDCEKSANRIPKTLANPIWKVYYTCGA